VEDSSPLSVSFLLVVGCRTIRTNRSSQKGVGHHARLACRPRHKPLTAFGTGLLRSLLLHLLGHALYPLPNNFLPALRLSSTPSARVIFWILRYLDTRHNNTAATEPRQPCWAILPAYATSARCWSLVVQDECESWPDADAPLGETNR